MKKSIFYSYYNVGSPEDLKSNAARLSAIEKVIDVAKENEIDGIEILPDDKFYIGGRKKTLDFAKKLREKMDGAGIACSCYFDELSMLDDPAASRKRLKLGVEVAEILGAPYFQHSFHLTLRKENFTSNMTVSKKEEQIFVKLGRATAEYAGEKGIACIYDDQSLYLNTIDRMGDLICKIGMTNTGICLRCGNSLYYNNITPEAFAAAFISIIKHVHINGVVKNEMARFFGNRGKSICLSGPMKNTAVGVDVDFEKIFAILNTVSYDGFYSLENQSGVYNNSEIKDQFNNLEYFYKRALAQK